MAPKFFDFVENIKEEFSWESIFVVVGKKFREYFFFFKDQPFFGAILSEFRVNYTQSGLFSINSWKRRNKF